jgi:hypothetical protein
VSDLAKRDHLKSGAIHVADAGPLEVRLVDGPTVLGAPKERALLEMLALRAGQPIATESLWSGLQEGHISHLRHVLPPASICEPLGRARARGGTTTKPPSSYISQPSPRRGNGIGEARAQISSIGIFGDGSQACFEAFVSGGFSARRAGWSVGYGPTSEHAVLGAATGSVLLAARDRTLGTGNAQRSPALSNTVEIGCPTRLRQVGSGQLSSQGRRPQAPHPQAHRSAHHSLMTRIPGGLEVPMAASASPASSIRRVP